MLSDDHQRLYQQLVNLHWREVYAYAYRLSSNHVEAQDIVQQTYLHAWQSIAALRDPSRGRSWLYTIARRAFWRSMERRGHPEPMDVNAIADHHDDHRDVDEHDAVQVVLKALDRKLREPFLMVAMEGMSCEQAAKELDIPVGTVLSRISRARAALQSILAENKTPRAVDAPDRSADSGGQMPRGGR